MKPGARALLGWILLAHMAIAAVTATAAGGKAGRQGGTHHPGAPAAAPAVAPAVARAVALAELDGELAAVVHDAQHPLASLSVLAIRDGKVVYQQQFGLRHVAGGDAAQAELPVTPVTFRIASMSTMVTAIGAMKLVEDGLIDLDTDISAYIGFPVRNPHFSDTPVTLRHLLTHTSSLRDGAGDAWGSDTVLKDVLSPGAAKYGKGEVWAANEGPGRYFTYCNLNWSVISALMEKVTGERVDRLMKRLVLDPMGIAAVTPGEVNNPAALASGLGKLMLMLLNKGKYEGRQILAPETIALMASAQWSFDGRNGDTLHGRYFSWGLGLQRFDPAPGIGNRLVEGGEFHAVGQLGDADGLVSAFALDFAHRNGLVSLIGGAGTAPDAWPGSYSALVRSEELILTSLYRRAILGSEGR